MLKKLTISHHEKINAQNGKSFSDLVVRVLEFALHDCCVYFYDDNTAQTSKYHSVITASACHSIVQCFPRGVEVLLSTSPLIGEEGGCDGVGEECYCAVYTCQSQNLFRADAERLVQDGCMELENLAAGSLKLLSCSLW
jgi:hypothetical protein